MKRVLLSTTVLAVAIAAGSAQAADLGIREAAPPVKAPPYVAPLYTWTGFYLGGNIGYGWVDGSGTYTTTGWGNGVSSGPFSGHGDGILGGGQIGYNYQMGAFVVGLETDFQGTGGTGHINGSAPGNALVAKSSIPWFGTIRGRLGYAVNNWLFYVTGGGAYADNELKGTVNGVNFGDVDKVGWSWTLGGGIEAFVAPRWSVKAEYLYIDTPDSVPLPARTTASGHANTNIVRVGLNYHF